jgi:hypothetical protein
MAFHTMPGLDDCGEPLTCGTCGDETGGGACGRCAHEARVESREHLDDDAPMACGECGACDDCYDAGVTAECSACGGEAEWGEDLCAQCAEEESEYVD